MDTIPENVAASMSSYEPFTFSYWKSVRTRYQNVASRVLLQENDKINIVIHISIIVEVIIFIPNQSDRSGVNYDPYPEVAQDYPWEKSGS